VVVALPEMAHKEAILAALGRGLHVLTEKPLAMTMAEAAEIVQAARRSPVSVVMVDQNYRWRPQTRALREAVRGGRIGKVGSVSYEYRQPITRTPPTPGANRCRTRSCTTWPPPLRPPARLYRPGMQHVMAFGVRPPGAGTRAFPA